MHLLYVDDLSVSVLSSGMAIAARKLQLNLDQKSHWPLNVASGFQYQKQLLCIFVEFVITSRPRYIFFWPENTMC